MLPPRYVMAMLLIDADAAVAEVFATLPCRYAAMLPQRYAAYFRL